MPSRDWRTQRSQNGKATQHKWQAVMCPACHAAPGEPCTRREGGHRVPLFRSLGHPQRQAAAEQREQLPFHEAGQ